MRQKVRGSQVLTLLVLAFFFWYASFVGKWLNFWLSMAIATTTLTAFATYFGGFALSKGDITFKHFVWGIGSAAVLYGIFVAGNSLSQLLFHFAKPEISAIYTIRGESQAWIIGFVLLFITSPGEELFWRAFWQQWAMEHWGEATGWFVGSLVYAAVHLVSGNIMLVLAAWVAGLYWGFLYWKTQSVFTCIVSHALWTAAIFVLWPVG